MMNGDKEQKEKVYGKMQMLIRMGL